MAHTTTNFTDKNNVISGTAGSLEAIEEPNSRYDFGIKWVGANGALNMDFPPGQPSVGLVQGRFPMNPDFGAQAYQNGYGWDSGYAAISVDWAAGTLAGSIKELYYACTFSAGSVTARVLAATRDNIDPGYGAIGSGRNGQQYSFLITGTEFRVYNAREASPVLILASPTQGPGFPLSLGAWVFAGATPRFNVTDIRIVRIRANQFSTTYAVRDQIADFGTRQLGHHIRIYQNPNGAPLDIDI